MRFSRDELYTKKNKETISYYFFNKEREREINFLVSELKKKRNYSKQNLSFGHTKID